MTFWDMYIKPYNNNLLSDLCLVGMHTDEYVFIAFELIHTFQGRIFRMIILVKGHKNVF